MFKKLIDRYHRSYRYYGNRSNNNYVNYLKINGVKIGGGCFIPLSQVYGH